MMQGSTRGLLGICMGLVIGFAVGCGSAEDDAEFRGDIIPSPSAWIPAPLGEAYCQINVTGTGWVDMEADYLPHVITCENGGANLEALKAQAIAARSVAYYYMANQGSVCDSQGCQVYSCGSEPSAKAYQAVDETSGIYLSFNNVLTYAFYVAGDPNTDPPSCVGTPGVGTEGWVTYNEGQSGDAVEQTDLGWVFNVGESGYGQNRGCMSQWGARCLENANGYGYEDILRFYYGEDITFTQAQGPCVMEVGDDGDTTTTTTTTDDGSTAEGDSTTSEGSTDEGGSTTEGGADDGTCTIGSLGCICTLGGGCDPGLVCDDGFCIPDGPNEDGEGSTGEGGDGGSADEIGDEGLPPGFGNEGAGEDGCACTSTGRGGSSGAAGWLVIGLLGLVRRRR